MQAAAHTLQAGKVNSLWGAPTFFFSFFFSAFLFIRSSSATSSCAFFSASWGRNSVSASSRHCAVAERVRWPRARQAPAPCFPEEAGRTGKRDLA